MAYIRVLPRDLFNEANLLKCYGRLWIELETAGDHGARFLTEDVDQFEIEQDETSGSLYIANVDFAVNGNSYRLARPLNARSSWPLYAENEDEAVPVFDDNGNLSHEMRTLIAAEG